MADYTLSAKGVYDGSKFDGPVGKSADALDRLKSKCDSLASAAGGMSALGESLMSAGKALTAGVTLPMAAGVAAAGRFALGVASSAEQTEISFTTMLGGAEQAAAMMDDLADFAARTPFELSGLQTATRQLLAYGFAAEDVIPMLTDVGDATSALGTGQAGIEAVTRALGQMKTRGKVSAEEMLQLTEAGIPAWEYLARAIGTDTAGAMKAVSDGAVSASEGIEAITAGMRDDFGGMMESQSKTVTGLMSNLSDAIEKPLMSLKDTDAYDRLSESLAGLVDSAGPFVESLLPHMEKGLDGVSGVLDKASDAMDAFAAMGEEGQEEILGLVGAAAGAGPVLTALGGGLKLAGSLASGFPSALGKVSGILGKIPGPAALAATAVGIVAGEAMEAAAHADLLADATQGAGEILASTPEAASAFPGFVERIGSKADGALERLKALNDQASDTCASMQADSALLDSYVSTIERLADKSGLSAREQNELKSAVDGYNKITGDTVEIIDIVNGKLSDSTGYIDDNAEAWKRNAKAQALQELATDYYKEQAKASNDLAEAQKALNEADEGFGIWLGDFAVIADEASVKHHELQQSVDDLSAAYDTAKGNADAFSTQASIAASGLAEEVASTLEGLSVEMQGYGLDIAYELAAGIESGQLSASEAAQFIKSSVDSVIAGLTPEMQAHGAAAAVALAGAVSDGSITVSEASSILQAAASGGISSLPEELQGYAAVAASMFSSGLAAGEGPVASSSSALGEAAKGGVSAVPGLMSQTGAQGGAGFASGVGSGEGATRSSADLLAAATEAAGANTQEAHGWGSELGSNFASGISSAWDAVVGAASSLAGAVADFLHFTEPDIGPLVGINDSGYELAQNYAAAMSAGKPLVSRAAESLAEAASFAASPSFEASWRVSVPTAWQLPGAPSMSPPSGDGAQPGGDASLRAEVSAIRRELSMLRQSMPDGVYMDGRRIGYFRKRFA